MEDKASWGTPAYRTAVASKIGEEVTKSGKNLPQSVLEMENLLFEKSRSKDEYLWYIVRLVLRIRHKNIPEIAVLESNQRNLDVPDLTNALLTLAIQDNQNPLTLPNAMANHMDGIQGQISQTQVLFPTWPSMDSRQLVTFKIDEAIQQAGQLTPCNALDMEKNIYDITNSKEEYMSYATALIQHFRNMNIQGMAGSSQAAPGFANFTCALQELAIQDNQHLFVASRSMVNQMQLPHWPWTSPAYRQLVISKIDDVIRQSGVSALRSSIEMENHVFQKAKSKEEYLGYVARLILHILESSDKPMDKPMPCQMGCHLTGQVTSQMEVPPVDWTTPAFRLSVMSKIEETIAQSGVTTSRGGLELEKQIFEKANSKEEYLVNVARLIVQIRKKKEQPGDQMSISNNL